MFPYVVILLNFKATSGFDQELDFFLDFLPRIQYNIVQTFEFLQLSANCLNYRIHYALNHPTTRKFQEEELYLMAISFCLTYDFYTAYVAAANSQQHGF